MNTFLSPILKSAFAKTCGLSCQIANKISKNVSKCFVRKLVISKWTKIFEFFNNPTLLTSLDRIICCHPIQLNMLFWTLQSLNKLLDDASSWVHCCTRYTDNANSRYSKQKFSIIKSYDFIIIAVFLRYFDSFWYKISTFGVVSDCRLNDRLTVDIFIIQS